MLIRVILSPGPAGEPLERVAARRLRGRVVEGSRVSVAGKASGGTPSSRGLALHLQFRRAEAALPARSARGARPRVSAGSAEWGC